MAGKPCSLKIRDSDNEEDDNEYNFTRNYLSNTKSKEVQSNVLATERSDSESETDDDSENDEDSSFDPDYNLQYEIDNFEIDTEKENEEEKKLIDSLADSTGAKEIAEVEFLNPETLARHRPSFEVLQQSLLDNSEKTAPPEVIITVLTCETYTDTDVKMIYNYKVNYEKLMKCYNCLTLTNSPEINSLASGMGETVRGKRFIDIGFIIFFMV